MELSRRTAREVLDDHLTIANQWTGRPFEDILEEDIRRNVAADVVIVMPQGVYHGHEGVRQLAHQLADELPQHLGFDYLHVVAEGRVGLLVWTYEDDQVRVSDGVDSYLIEDGKIVGQTIHYTVTAKG
ncbi:MAG TPA: nuclear transport factor 2 family protein [Microlunatus sp.]